MQTTTETQTAAFRYSQQAMTFAVDTALAAKARLVSEVTDAVHALDAARDAADAAEAAGHAAQVDEARATLLEAWDTLCEKAATEARTFAAVDQARRDAMQRFYKVRDSGR